MSAPNLMILCRRVVTVTSRQMSCFLGEAHDPAQPCYSHPHASSAGLKESGHDTSVLLLELEFARTLPCFFEVT